MRGSEYRTGRLVAGTLEIREPRLEARVSDARVDVVCGGGWGGRIFWVADEGCDAGDTGEDLRGALDVSNLSQGDTASQDVLAIEGAGGVFDADAAGDGVGKDTAAVAVAGERNPAAGVTELEGELLEVEALGNIR